MVKRIAMQALYVAFGALKWKVQSHQFSSFCQPWISCKAEWKVSKKFSFAKFHCSLRNISRLICFRFLVSPWVRELIIETSLFEVSVYGVWCFLHIKSCYPTAFNIFACGKWFSWVFKFNFVTLHKANADGAYDSINNAVTKTSSEREMKNSIADWVHKFTTTINKCQCFRH